MTTESLSEPGVYRPRDIQSHGIAEMSGWRMKQYSITADTGPIDPSVMAAAERVAMKACLEVSSDRGGRNPVGFSILHSGAEAMWLLVDFWTGDIISQLAFGAALDDPTAFEPVPRGRGTVCVWEMEVFSHERDSFVEHMMSQTGPNTENYLHDVIGSQTSTRDLVAAFNAAWVAGDVDALMDLMTLEPEYHASTGPGPGTAHIGSDAVRSGFEQVLAAEAEVDSPAPPSDHIVVDANSAVSFWSYPQERADGTVSTIDGVDVWTVIDGRLAVKDAYRKAFDDPR